MWPSSLRLQLTTTSLFYLIPQLKRRRKGKNEASACRRVDRTTLSIYTQSINDGRADVLTCSLSLPHCFSLSLLRTGSVYGSGLKGCAQVLKAIEQPLAN